MRSVRLVMIIAVIFLICSAISLCAYSPASDFDKDGTPDYKDLDDDNDLVPDYFEVMLGTSYHNPESRPLAGFIAIVLGIPLAIIGVLILFLKIKRSGFSVFRRKAKNEDEDNTPKIVRDQIVKKHSVGPLPHSFSVLHHAADKIVHHNDHYDAHGLKRDMIVENKKISEERLRAHLGHTATVSKNENTLYKKETGHEGFLSLNDLAEKIDMHHKLREQARKQNSPFSRLSSRISGFRRR